jgi:hypothetical protein
MNLSLSPAKIEFIGILSDNTTVNIRDDIGFSTADLDSGFNYSDASPMFVDGSAVDYPEMSEAVFFLFAWHIPYDDSENPDEDVVGNALTVSRTSTVVLTSIDTATGTAGNFDYAANANNWGVAALDDGWIKLKMIAFDNGTGSDTYYYNAANNDVRQVSDDAIIDPATLVDIVPTAEVNLLKTSLLDENIAWVEKCYTLAKMKGECKDEDTWREHLMVLQVGRTTAKIQFDSYGNMFSAQQIIEFLNTYVEQNDLTKPNI